VIIISESGLKRFFDKRIRQVSYDKIVEVLCTQIVNSHQNHSKGLVLFGLKTGGDILSKRLEIYLDKEGLDVKRLPITIYQTGRVGECFDRIADEYLRDRYVIGVDDALWTGGHRDAFYRHMERHKEGYGFVGRPLFAVIFDSIGDADFSYMKVSSDE